MRPAPFRQISEAVRAALAEDLSEGDVTTATLLPKARRARARIRANAPMTVAGIEAARLAFFEVDRTVTVTSAVEDGTVVPRGTIVLEITGDGRSLLMAERVALNFLQRLSGIATLTSQYVAAVRGYRTRILDTRKTTPGLRAIEKWAVRLGGGFNHRFSLGDGLLIKDNHLALLKAQGVGVTQACRRAKEQAPHHLRTIVEVESLDEVRAAIEGDADVILLDNMSPAQIREAVALIKGRAVVEVSGGITLDNVREMAAAGADFISIGALTHSAPAADLSMEVVPFAAKRRTRR
jgi:nicotinate-nucleotide pyrophosphorylase (carboxylating)